MVIPQHLINSWFPWESNPWLWHCECYDPQFELQECYVIIFWSFIDINQLWVFRMHKMHAAK